MDGTALIYCEGALGTPRGRTANNLLRYGTRYQVVGVIDSRHAGRPAREVVEGANCDALVFADLAQALAGLEEKPRYLVVGLSPEDNRLPLSARHVIGEAVKLRINVDCALRPFLRDDAELPQLAMVGAELRSVGYPVPLTRLRSYTGSIELVRAFKVAVTGTTPPVGGKNVTAVRLADSLKSRRVSAEMIGTSESAWFQGVRHSVILDSILHSYIAGEIEAVIVQAEEVARPQVMVLEGRGSLLDRAHPADLELLTTARPDAVILQHAPLHESFSPDDVFGVKSVERHIKAIEALADKRVVALALSHTEEDRQSFAEACESLRAHFRLPVVDVLADGCAALAGLIAAYLRAEWRPAAVERNAQLHSVAKAAREQVVAADKS